MNFKSFFIAPTLLVLVACSGGLSESELISRAREALENGDSNAAIIDAKSVLQGDPTNVSGRYLLGRAYLAQLNAPAAVEEFEKALKPALDPEIRGWYMQALLASGGGRELAEMEPDDSWTPRSRAAYVRAVASNGDLKEAREVLGELGAGRGGGPYVSNTRVILQLAETNDVSAAKDSLLNVINAYTGDAESQILLSNLMISSGDLVGASDVLANLASSHPERLEERLKLVALYTESGSDEAAETELAKLEALVPDYPGVRFARGRLQVREGNFEDALQSLSAVLGANPKHLPSLYLSGAANVETGNYATARRQLRQYLEMGSADVDSGASVQLARAELGLGDAAAAENIIREVLLETPMNIKAMAVLAVALATQGSHEASAEVYANMASLEPESAFARLGSGEQLIAAGRVDQGLTELRAAVDLQPDNDVVRQRLIVSLASAGRFLEARSEAASYVSAREGTAIPLLSAAGVEMLAQEYDRARGFYEKALAIEPASAEARKGVASLDLMAGEVEKAKAAFERILQDEPEDIQSLLNLASLAERGGNLDAMVRYLSRAIEVRSDLAAPRLRLAQYYVGREQPNQAVEVLEPLRNTLAAQDFATKRALAGAYGEAGRSDDAIDMAEEALKMKPDDLALLSVLSSQEEKRGNFDAALGYTERALAVAPNNLMLLRRQLRLLVRQRNIGGAAIALNNMPSEVRDEPVMLNLAGRIAVAENRFADAEVAFARALAKSSTPANLLSLALLQWRDDRRNEAIQTLSDWVEDNPEVTAVRAELAARLLAVGREGEATREYQAVVNAEPENGPVLNNLAWLLRYTDSAAAADYASRAVELMPDNPNVYDTFAMVELARNKPTVALTYIEKALDLAPEVAEFRLTQARAYAAAGQTELALEALDQLIAGPPFSTMDDANELRKTLLRD